MDEYSRALIETVERVTPEWVQRLVAKRVEMNDAIRADAHTAAGRATEYVVTRLTQLLQTDIDEQANTPLAIMRDATKFASAVLSGAGARIVERDDYARRMFPDDVYGLTPANWSDIDESLVDVGLAWGAAKVMDHRSRHGRSK